jgi:hypothetical protein
MAEKPTLTIELTKAQQLEILAATGLLVKTLVVDAAADAENGAAPAQLPFPRWLIQETVAR